MRAGITKEDTKGDFICGFASIVEDHEQPITDDLANGAH